MRRFIKGSAMGAGILLLLASLTNCGAANFATDLRIAVAAGAPILNILVQQGKISPSLRDGLIADLTAEVNPIAAMAQCFSAIPNGDPQSKLKHLQCVQTLERAPETHKLLSDFSANPTVSNIADDFDGILQGAIIFYGGTSKTLSRTVGGVAVPVTEGEIRARIKRFKADLGQR